ncbi:hypothetical protein K432DRAFT_401558 [Lepidopterella palustris CBS 459.81]|uniref:C2H2-type domain-containing protein n=1 Tax=Lepidopterella palustris CBS 459.81 TaxID=1314670 RepID=A0A8E2EHZ8_9PEZI|nr:hypothetical protein K432DRAFT_401558 [Lepidopterella palustris CBS 459.81]
MGKKKRTHPDLQDKLDRPWCFYCERDFDDLKILISHQKAKHFKCERCGRRLNTAGGLQVHMNQVHKETLTVVENALPHRHGLEIEIFGMEGIPDEVVAQHNQRVTQQHFADLHERSIATGNPIAGYGGFGGGAGGSGHKKPKLESKEDLKKRLAEHKARKAAEKEGGATSSGNATPLDGTPGVVQSPGGGFQSVGSPSFGGAHISPPPAYGHPYGQSAYSQAPQHPYQPQPAPLLHGTTYYSPPVTHATASPQYQNPYQGYSMTSPPPLQYRGGAYHPPPHSMSTASSDMHQPPNTLPPPAGLPQRPSFAPDVNAEQSPVATSIHEPAQNEDPAAETTPAAEKAVPTKKKYKKDPAFIRLVYTDNEMSPEEKMAKLARYAFVPDHAKETVLGVSNSAVTGAVNSILAAEPTADMVDNTIDDAGLSTSLNEASGKTVPEPIEEVPTTMADEAMNDTGTVTADTLVDKNAIATAEKTRDETMEE